MLGVVVFIEGKFRYGSEGVGYSKSPKYSFPATSVLVYALGVNSLSLFCLI